MPDSLTLMNVDIFMALLSIELFTRAMMSARDPVQVPTISGQVVTLAIPEITVTRWFRLLVGDSSRHGTTRVRACDYFRSMARSTGESDMAVAMRLCLALRAAAADLDRPHTSSMALFRRFVTTEQPSSMCHNIMVVLSSSATE